MDKIFVDKFVEITAEENGTESPYGIQIMKATIQRLTSKVEQLEKDVAELKAILLPTTGFTGYNYISPGYPPISGVAPAVFEYTQEQLDALSGLENDDSLQYFAVPPAGEYTTT